MVGHVTLPQVRDVFAFIKMIQLHLVACHPEKYQTIIELVILRNYYLP